MAAQLRYVSGRTGYKDILRHVHEEGETRSPRGLKTLDVGYATIELLSPYDALPTGLGRKLSKRVAAAEAVQLIGGFADPQLLLSASPTFARYIEPSGTFWGAYGRRIAHGRQLPAVVRKLMEDSDTRQAVVTLWDPQHDNNPGHKDYPCTLALGFSIKRGKLELDVTMRSNDVWRGLPYDLFQFTQLQLTVANVLNLEPSHYRHHTYSLHLYAEDVEKAMNCYFGATDDKPSYLPTGFGNVTSHDIDHAMRHARLIGDHTDTKSFTCSCEMDDSERWYFDALHPTK